MKAVIYSSTPLGKTGGVPKFNAAFFPCHAFDVETVYLNGSFPEIEELCSAEGLACKPYSEFKIPNVKKDKANG